MSRAIALPTSIGYCIVLNFEPSGEKFKTYNNRFVAITF